MYFSSYVVEVNIKMLIQVNKNMLKLTIELVPKTSWCSNVRTKTARAQWDKIRLKCYNDAHDMCEICGKTGTNGRIECHEIWDYDDENHIQKLIGLIALCPKCHQVKHAGLAQIKGKINEVISQLSKINKISNYDAEEMLREAFMQYHSRSCHEWTVDISYIDEYLK